MNFPYIKTLSVAVAIAASGYYLLPSEKDGIGFPSQENITSEKPNSSIQEEQSTFSETKKSVTHKTEATIHTTTTHAQDSGLLGIKYRDDIASMGEEEVQAEIESVSDLLERHGAIQGLNDDMYSADERQEINDAIAYLNKLRLTKLDEGLASVSRDIQAFKSEVEDGYYPPPQPLSQSQIEDIKREHSKAAETQNADLQIKIETLAGRNNEDYLGELGNF